MAPRLFGGRAPLLKAMAALLMCSLFLLSQAGAFQSSIQLETTNSGRRIKTRVEPEYPELALKARISGTARVSVVVTAEGTIKDVKELGGSPILLAALVRAVKQWKYEPAPKESEIEVKAAFSR